MLHFAKFCLEERQVIWDCYKSYKLHEVYCITDKNVLQLRLSTY